MKEKSLPLPGLKISYLTNEAEAPAIIFIHGNCLSKEIFNYQFGEPLLNKFNLIAPDLPGHGKTIVTDGNKESLYSVPGLAEVINNFILELKIEEYILVGHSLGGHIAIESNGSAVNCRGICIFQTPPAPKPIDVEKMFLPDELFGLIYKRDLSDEEMNIIAAKFVQYEDQRKILFNMIKQTDDDFRQFFGQSVASGNTRNEVAIIETFPRPVAIFHGQNERLVNLDYIQDLNVNLWNNKVEMIPKAGHCPQFENPAYFNFLLDRFASECF
jgi:pimeloyl-ACP methyl ester carboxylesterase